MQTPMTSFQLGFCRQSTFFLAHFRVDFSSLHETAPRYILDLSYHEKIFENVQKYFVVKMINMNMSPGGGGALGQGWVCVNPIFGVRFL